MNMGTYTWFRVCCTGEYGLLTLLSAPLIPHAAAPFVMLIPECWFVNSPPQ